MAVKLEDMTPADLEQLSAWRRKKDRDLLRRDGWLALAGLHWFSEGRHSAGSDEKADIRLPSSVPARLGDFEMRGGTVYFHRSDSPPRDGLPPDGAPLQPDTAEEPTYLRVGDVTLVVIERSGRLGLRIWDNARLSSGFGGRTWFAPDPAFRFQAEFEPGKPGSVVPVPDVTGDVAEQPCLGTARFLFHDVPSSLRAVPADGEGMWFLFADATNGVTTYPSGRFLVAPPPEREGLVVLDFNRAYNPPCAFTAYATCPLPPEGNRLDFPVEAGEMYRHDP
jgi:uncharacterized protein (DUF1684 family)